MNLNKIFKTNIDFKELSDIYKYVDNYIKNEFPTASVNSNTYTVIKENEYFDKFCEKYSEILKSDMGRKYLSYVLTKSQVDTENFYIFNISLENSKFELSVNTFTFSKQLMEMIIYHANEHLIQYMFEFTYSPNSITNFKDTVKPLLLTLKDTVEPFLDALNNKFGFNLELVGSESDNHSEYEKLYIKNNNADINKNKLCKIIKEKGFLWDELEDESMLLIQGLFNSQLIQIMNIMNKPEVSYKKDISIEINDKGVKFVLPSESYFKGSRLINLNEIDLKLKPYVSRYNRQTLRANHQDLKLEFLNIDQIKVLNKLEEIINIDSNILKDLFYQIRSIEDNFILSIFDKLAEIQQKNPSFVSASLNISFILNQYQDLFSIKMYPEIMKYLDNHFTLDLNHQLYLNDLIKDLILYYTKTSTLENYFNIKLNFSEKCVDITPKDMSLGVDLQEPLKSAMDQYMDKNYKYITSPIFQIDHILNNFLNILFVNMFTSSKDMMADKTNFIELLKSNEEIKLDDFHGDDLSIILSSIYQDLSIPNIGIENNTGMENNRCINLTALYNKIKYTPYLSNKLIELINKNVKIPSIEYLFKELNNHNLDLILTLKIVNNNLVFGITTQEKKTSNK